MRDKGFLMGEILGDHEIQKGIDGIDFRLTCFRANVKQFKSSLDKQTDVSVA